MTEKYIKAYVRLLTHPELSRLEALLICEIMLFPLGGCWKSSHNLAKLLGSDTRTIQKKIVLLQNRQWLAVLQDPNHPQERWIWATLKEPPAGPLFEYAEKAAEAIEKKKQSIRRKQISKMTQKLFTFAEGR